MWSVLRSAILLLSCGLLSVGCGGPKPASAQPSQAANLNLYIWSGDLASDTLPNFEKRTGIRVHVTYYDTNETLETKLLAGSSGYDVVSPSAPFFERQISAGVYMALDKSRLPNIRNMDPELMSRVAANDPGNDHGVIYVWGTDGIGYNEKMVKALLPDAPVDSWRLIFDPTVASKVAKCGISVLDAPAEMIRIALTYLGRDPNAQIADDLAAAASALVKIRPYIRNINSSEYVEALANGDICVAVAYNGDVMQSRDRAKEAGRGVVIKYSIPKEGTLLWFDMLAIPKNAPHPASAYAFMNYMMEPEVTAAISNYMRYANANAAASPLVDASIAGDPGIYPTAEQRQHLFVQLGDSQERARAITRIWQEFKTAQ
jgi:putrescine transport system substrate-binding protein